VQQVVILDFAKPPYGFKALGGAAVIADNSWAAMQGRRKLKAVWDLGEHAAYDSAAYKTALSDTVKKPGRVVRETGNVDAEFAKGGKIIEASYYTPILAHAPMEPPAAVAEFQNGKVEIWAATQNPQAVQDTVARALNIKRGCALPRDSAWRRIRTEVQARLRGRGRPSLEAGRQTGEDCLEPRGLYPLRLFHSPAGMYIKAAVGDKGLPTAWLQRSEFPPIASQNNLAERYGGFQLGMGWTDVPYPIANLRVENGPAQAHFRIGWLRSVSNIYHAFAVQSFTDELAAAAGRDRVEYLLDIIGQPRSIDFGKEGLKQAGPQIPSSLSTRSAFGA
jgi:isoquinoline 1-oxidoreductase beta subunit